MIKGFYGSDVFDLQNQITAYHNRLNSKAMDWVMTSCSITSVGGRMQALVIFNSKRLGDV